METQTKVPGVAERLEKLGMNAAASKVRELTARKRKMAVAYEHYRFVRPEKIHAFNDKLLASTRDKYGNYKQLSFTAVQDYREVPPAEVLEKLEQAIERKCFDKFEIAHIIDVRDPILFGCIDKCTDRFFIGQWDDDVKIEDILKPNEG